MAIKSMQDFFIHELSDIYSAEKQLARALPKLARAAANPELSQAFEAHLEETHGQIERIDQLVDKLDLKLKRIKCVAMEGLIEESKEAMDAIEQSALRDAALIASAQKVEHYEIAAYGTLCALAKQLNHPQDVLRLLQDTLKEEKYADQKLSMLAEQKGTNRDAVRAAA